MNLTVHMYFNINLAPGGIQSRIRCRHLIISRTKDVTSHRILEVNEVPTITAYAVFININLLPCKIDLGSIFAQATSFCFIISSEGKLIAVHQDHILIRSDRFSWNINSINLDRSTIIKLVELMKRNSFVFCLQNNVNDIAMTRN